jgi:predicted transcriptional regulator
VVTDTNAAAVNAKQMSATNSFVVVVNEVNVAPVLPGQINRTINELTLLTVTNMASDSDLPGDVTATGSLTSKSDAASSVPQRFYRVVLVQPPTGPAPVIQSIYPTNGIATITWSSTAGQTYRVQYKNNLNDPSWTDLPANTLSYQLLNPPPGAGISSSGVIKWATEEGQGPSTNTFTTVVTDNGVPALSTTNSFVVVVNEVNVPPVLPGQINRTINELALLTVANTASDSDLPVNGLSYALSGPAGASIDANGVITWTPTEGQGPSTNTFTTVVTDTNAAAVNEKQMSATNSFVVVVNEVNVPPVLPGQIGRTINELTLLTVVNTASDSDEPVNGLSYALSGPSGASIDANGVITWTPTEGQGPSANTFTTVVTDTNAAAVNAKQMSTTNSFVVVVNEVNVAPVLLGQTNRTINELTLLTVTNTASDGDLPANGLSYALSGPGGASIDGNGVITWTPAEGQGPSTNTFTTVVTDTNAAAVNAKQMSATNGFVVMVNEVNVAPVLPWQINRTVPMLVQLTVTNTASDSDLPVNALTYALSVPSGAGGASIDAHGVITWKPPFLGLGTYTFTTVVTDTNPAAVNSKQLSATNSFVVEVTLDNSVNAPPVLPEQTNRTINELTLLTVTNTALDPNFPANALSYVLNGPSGASIDTNGVISWTPTEAQGPGTNTFTTVVTDNGAPPLSATNSFVVVVNEMNVAPVAAGGSYIVSNATLTVTAPGVLGNDFDADVPANSLTAVLVEGPAHGALSLSANGGFSYTPTSGFNGTDTFAYQANDGQTHSAVATVTITVSNQVQFRITSIIVSNGVAWIAWDSVSGQTYHLQYKDSLSDPSWNDLAPAVTATGPTAGKSDTVDSVPQRIYRIKLVP